MTSLRAAAEEFLAQRRIAVAGVSRDEKQPANLIYRRLRAAGYEVYAINPNAETAEGDVCFGAVQDVPVELDGIVIVTTPEVAEHVVTEAHQAGVPRVWLHRGLGTGSSSANAVAFCKEHGMTVIPGGCPNMFGATADTGHRCMRVVLQLSGKVPRKI